MASRAIHANAAGGPGYNGYYVWGRFGFNTAEGLSGAKNLTGAISSTGEGGFAEFYKEMGWSPSGSPVWGSDVALRFDREFPDMASVFAHPVARKWWKEFGHGWSATFDLNGSSWDVMQGYIEAKYGYDLNESHVLFPELAEATVRRVRGNLGRSVGEGGTGRFVSMTGGSAGLMAPAEKRAVRAVAAAEKVAKKAVAHVTGTQKANDGTGVTVTFDPGTTWESDLRAAGIMTGGKQSPSGGFPVHTSQTHR